METPSFTCTCTCICAEEPHDVSYGNGQGNGDGMLYFVPTRNGNCNGTDINVGMFGSVSDNDAPISAVSAPVCRVMDAGMVLLALCRLRFKQRMDSAVASTAASAPVLGYFHGDLHAMERTLFEVAFLFRCPWGSEATANETRNTLFESSACNTPIDPEAQSEGPTEVGALIDVADMSVDEALGETLNQVREHVIVQTAGVLSAEVMVAETSHFFNVAMIRELAAKARDASRASIECAAATHAQTQTQPKDELEGEGKGEEGDQGRIPSRMKSSWPWSI